MADEEGVPLVAKRQSSLPFKCLQCEQEYEAPNRCALLGICGHSMCEPCVKSLGLGDDFTCPRCQDDDSVLVESSQIIAQTQEAPSGWSRVRAFLSERWHLANKTEASPREPDPLAQRQREHDAKLHPKHEPLPPPDEPGTGGVCKRCSLEYIGEENTETSCLAHPGDAQNKAGWSTIWVYVLDGGTATDKAQVERRRWCCCPDKVVVGTYDDLLKVPHGFHI
mmetsp:Transcript_7648/g.16904  ORF Transcript_7648/g.16904 Transcript_7648/m.16904 type:complete len:223 (+) Transcript_7648:3-671(+)